MKRRDRGRSLSWTLAFGIVLVTGLSAWGDSPPPPSVAEQLLDLGRRARAQGATAQAETFYRKVLTLDPGNAAALRALGGLRRGASEPAQATIAAAGAVQEIFRQQLTADVSQRLQAARALVNEGRPEAALDALRLAQTVVRSALAFDDATREALDRRIQAAIIATVNDEERIVAQRAERLRLEAAAGQQARALEERQRGQDTLAAVMTQFDSLMAQGQFNVLARGGLGDVAAATAPYADARRLAQSAQALAPGHPAPRAGVSVAQSVGLLAQALASEQIKEHRFLLSLQDVDRAAVPFADTATIEYPDVERWRLLSEHRIHRYGRAQDLLEPDAKTRSILAKLEQSVTMSFANETPLDEVLKYVRAMTQGPNDNGIPIYVDPVGLNEAGRTMASPVSLDLEGVPLKTTLRLLLKQLGLTYTVKSGLLTITAESSDNQPTEIRVYPVADLTIIPLSIMGASGGLGQGGFGGGMGNGVGNGMGNAGFRSTSPVVCEFPPF